MKQKFTEAKEKVKKKNTIIVKTYNILFSNRSSKQKINKDTKVIN